jgi:multidrug efflux pump subunit AcrA (membrane-fusion protein)
LSKIKFFGIGVLVAAMLYVVFNLVFASRRTVCGFSDLRPTISTIAYGPFSEFIPQTGTFHRDTVSDISTVKVPVDEMYFSRIVTGQDATTTFNNIDYQLQVTKVNPEVIGGRFTVEMNFATDTLPDITHGQSLRLRLRLSPTYDAVLLPVGGFYKDTGGKWIFFIEEGDKVVKRNIKLGRKNSENYEVLEGLKSGDRVITSSYENFGDKESYDLKEMRNK